MFVICRLFFDKLKSFSVVICNMGDYIWVKKVDENGVIRDALEYKERLMGFFFGGTTDYKVLLDEDERIVTSYDEGGERIAVIEGPHGKYHKKMNIDSTTPGLFG